MALTKLDKTFLFGSATQVVHKVSCDICGAEDLTKYVYGALRISHTWAELCVSCHVMHGIGIDMGIMGSGNRHKRGMIYRWNESNSEYETTIALISSYMQLLRDVGVTPQSIPNSTKNIERDLYDIAIDIEREWTNIHYDAAPYLEAMFNLRTMQDTYNGVSAVSIVRSFLIRANADRWHGVTARLIRIELKRKIRRR